MSIQPQPVQTLTHLKSMNMVVSTVKRARLANHFQ